MLRLNDFGVSEEWFFTVLFNDDIWVNLKLHMYPNKKTSNFYDYKDGLVAVSNGYLGLIKERKDLKYLSKPYTTAIDEAAKNGHFKVVRFLFLSRIFPQCEYSRDSLIWSAMNNHLPIVKFLWNFGCGGSVDAMDIAIENGHLEIVRFLQSKHVGFRGSSADEAAKNGHLHVIKFLHNKGYKFYEDIITHAVENNHLEVVTFLYNKGYRIRNT